MASAMLRDPKVWLCLISVSVGRAGEINQEAVKAILNASP